ncbi:Transcription factor bHLH140 [Diplonema papillatum]|nr:Transcription factor bHLH140 [Diplonema papillatum]
MSSAKGLARSAMATKRRTVIDLDNSSISSPSASSQGSDSPTTKRVKRSHSSDPTPPTASELEPVVIPRYSNPGISAAPKGPMVAGLSMLVSHFKRPENRAAPDRRSFVCNDEYLIAYDLYPKGAVHLLGFCLQPPVASVAGVSQLAKAHEASILGLHALARRIVERLKAEDAACAGLDFQIGYHAKPSLKPIHLHIMSTDYQSPCVKNRKHYFSFIPPHFVPASVVEQRLAATGAVRLLPNETQPVPAGPMPCRWCSSLFSTMPALKQHLFACPQNPCNRKATAAS